MWKMSGLKFTFAGLCFSLVTFFSHPVSAGQEEWVFSAVPQGTMLRGWQSTHWGGGLALGLEYGFTDSWGIKGTLSYDILTGIGEEPDLLSVALGGVHAVYTVDILQIIPYLQAGAEGAVIGGGSQDWNAFFGVRLGAGMDYLLTREWSLGLDIGYHLFIPDTRNLPAMVTVGFRIGRRWY